MIGNYFKTTLRSLLKNRAYSFLNIAGLATGIACASLIFLWVQDELTFNHNFEKRNNLYTIYENQTYDGKMSTFIATPGPMAKALKMEIPEIKAIARTAGSDQLLFSLGEKAITEDGSYADPEIFSMLKLSFVNGDISNAFKELHSVVINATMAKKFFGTADAVGKTLKINNEQEYTVTGVFNDLPKNSTFQFHWLAPIANIDHKFPWMQSWGANWAITYVELIPSANLTGVNKKLQHYLTSKNSGTKTECFLFGMNDWNLHNNFTNGKMDGGRIEYVRLFSIIGFIILIIACINFMNLSTARSEKRAKEVGVRKVMGAGKGKLIAQFIGEAIIMSFISVFIAVGLIYVALPSFNNLVQKELAIDIFEPIHLIYLLLIGAVTGLLAGSYPAFYLSSFNPVTVLKNIKLPAGAGFIRQSLVIIQFSISIILIIGTIIIYQQIQHVKNRDLGYNKSNLIYITTQGKLTEHFESVYQQLKQSGVVENASLSDFPVIQVWKNTDNYSWTGKAPSQNPLISFEDVSPQFVQTMGMKLLSGRDFYTNSSLDSNSVIINEAMAKQMGKEGRVGGILRDVGKKEFEIAGIVKDFLYNDMYAVSTPLVLYNKITGTNVLSIRIKSNVNLSEALAKVGAVMKINNPAYPFEYKFMDDDFDQLFKTETLTGKLAGVFASLAIFISCLGLFGLAAYTAERRIKEIGIRKVLGASVAGLTGLLSKDFLKLVGISCLIAFPVAWWALTNWLQGYQYRITINWMVFAIAGVVAMLIALATVSFQAIKAALSNPVDSLRNE
ncbi:ABC transporter permease [Mucilaginibacter sp. 22184]|uniref:ABC transporter permease n=1 Tax=Mucilaginibacter sp. 22184 TaxID=3453887 RepID=UPI003F87ADCD